MRKQLRRVTALGAFFVVVLAVAACGSGVPSNSVAEVAGTPITTQAFDHWMYVAAKSQAAQNPGAPVIVADDPPNFNNCIAQVRHQVASLSKTPAKQLRADCKQLFTALSSQVLDFLIKGYWYQAEAARDHVKVTNAEVQNAFTRAKAQQFTSDSQFQNFLTQTGQTLNDIIFRFRINTIFQKLIAKHTPKITPAAVQAYYTQHPSQFGTQATRNIRIILAKTAAQANAAKSALQSGKSWNTVAKQYSIDPTSKNTGGLLVGVTKGQQDAALDNAAFSAPLNKLEGPVKGEFGYYVFDVTKITGATHQSLAQATALIKQTLAGEASTNAQTAVNKISSQHWRSQTSCRSSYAISDCSGYKAAKTGTTG